MTKIVNNVLNSRPAVSAGMALTGVVAAGILAKNKRRRPTTGRAA